MIKSEQLLYPAARSKRYAFSSFPKVDCYKLKKEDEIHDFIASKTWCKMGLPNHDKDETETEDGGGGGRAIGADSSSSSCHSHSPSDNMLHKSISQLGK